MFRKSVYVVCVWLLLGLAGSASAGDPAFLGWWQFDDGAGTVAKDSSGNGYDGTVYDAAWETGNFGGALRFSGAEYVDVPAEVCSTVDMQLTATFWTFIDFLGDQWPFTFAAYTVPADNVARAFSAHLPWANGILYFDTGGTAGRIYEAGALYQGEPGRGFNGRVQRQQSIHLPASAFLSFSRSGHQSDSLHRV